MKDQGDFLGTREKNRIKMFCTAVGKEKVETKSERVWYWGGGKNENLSNGHKIVDPALHRYEK